MNIRLHIALHQFFNVIRLVGPIFACATIAVASMAPIPVMALIFLVYFTPLLLTWLIPVDCVRTGCTGSMKLTNERLSFWLVYMHYECDNCRTIHRAEVFDPNIEITVSG